ncbi:PKD domain-containing protein [Nakamurella sp.]|uniref:PKD domain-containing protein n=1 Tax=Nakamurella sp. TaxID=1869182 RepID=UPI003B3AB24A
MSTAVLTAGILVLPAAPASAAPAPVTQRPTDAATATALPTVQVDGVVWSQAIVGNTVYVGGSFTTATSAATDPEQLSTPRSNLLAYALDTGKLITSFDVPLNGQAVYLTTNPDKSRLYVGGDFTTAAGTTHRRLVAIDTATGKVDQAFKPSLDARVSAIYATSTTVYAAGSLSIANGVARQRFASFNAADGTLTAWAPTATGAIRAMTASPDGTKLIVGGQFQQVNGVNVYGLAALSLVDGSLVPWTASGQVRAYGNSSGITTLRTFGNVVYGTGYTFGPLPVSNTREFEGTFAADGNSGNLVWLEDCHGDSYDAYTNAGVVYAVSHAHECSTVGGFGEQAAGDERRALAFTEAATGTLNANTVSGYKNWAGTPSPTMLAWFPDLNVGTYTGQSQAAWTVTGSGPYVVMGGEFPTVNGQPQRGLVRFASLPTAPASVPPVARGSNLTPSGTSLAPGSVRLRWRSSWDRDDLELRYKIVRNGDKANPVADITGASTFWNRPILTASLTGQPSGNNTYRVYAYDPDGNEVQGDLASVTVAGAGVPATYAQKVISDGASLLYRLGEPAGGVAFDSIGTNDGTPGADVSYGVTGALVGDASTAYRFPGTSTGIVSGPQTSASASTPFTLEAWTRTTSTNGGIILDFGNRATGNSTSLDRALYFDNTGRIQFTVLSSGTLRTISSVNTYRDGNWHHVAATLSPAGMKLYVDGAQVASRPATTTATTMNGFWRIGGDRATSLSPRPTSGFLNGDIDEVAVYPTALSDAAILNHFQVGTGTVPNVLPTASFTTVVSGADLSVDGSASSDSDGSVTGYSWNWGDGTPDGTGPTAIHAYVSDGTFTVTLTVTDDRGGVGTTTRQVTVAPNGAPTAAFTSSVVNQTVTVDGSGSTDADGAISSYSWDWGDATPAGTGPTATHTYAGAGVHTVTLTVTDNRGGTAVVSHDVTTTEAPNQAPVAAFTSSASLRNLTVNASTSTDVDGTISSYSWDWGDGSPAGSGATATHTYSTDGSYTVNLTVVDDDGASGSLSRVVVIDSTAASDLFGRTVASGWANADIGGAWTLTGGASKFNTNGQTGQILLSTAGSGPVASLNAMAPVRDFTGSIDFAVDKAATGGGVYTTVSTRRVGTSSYQFTLKYLAGGGVNVAIVRVDNGAATSLGNVTVGGLTYTVGDSIRFKFSAVGSGTTTLTAKAWKVGAPEPTAAQITRTDSAASLQGAGTLSVQAYLSGSSTNAPVVSSFDNLALIAG